MKNLGAFFLLFILLLSMLPCTDEVTAIDEVANAHQQLSHDEDSEDSCSAICMCTCCGQRIVIVDQIHLQLQTATPIHDHTIKDYPFHIAQLSRNIWQPPKLHSI